MNGRAKQIEIELAAIAQAIQAQEGLQPFLSAEQLAAVLAPLQQMQASLQAERQAIVQTALQGSGAIAQGEGAMAVGERGAATRGDHSPLTVIQEQHNYATPSPPPSPADLARQRYLKRLAQRCNALPLAALGGEESAAEEVSLDQVYVALNTRTQVPLSEEERDKRRPQLIFEKERLLTAMEAASQTGRLALLGDPGSGKSSFVRQLVAWLANVELGQKTLPPDWPAALLPVLVNLRDLAGQLAGVELAGLSEEEQEKQWRAAVWQQWQKELAELGAADFAGKLEEALTEGNVLLVFDGLDEVAESGRLRVRQAVRATLNEYRHIARVIVTCRIRSYTGDAVFPGFTSHTLAPFNEAQIRLFVHAWYMAQANLGRLGPAEAQAKIQDLQQAAVAGDLAELAANPMLLTTMALIHQREVGLPRERVRLYSLAVQVLLGQWQKRKGMAVSPELAAVLDDGRKLRAILDRLGYEAHQGRPNKGQEAELSRRDVLALLEDEAYLGDVGLAAEFLDYVDQRAGLLLGQGGEGSQQKPQTYGFPHRTFQEYLAGCYLLTGREVARRFWQKAAGGDGWYLAAQLGAEELLYNNPHSTAAFLDLAYDLCPERAPQDETAWRATLWSGRLAALLGAAEIGRDDKPGGGPTYLERLLPRLLAALSDSLLPPIERAEAGRILARLGDPRPAVMTIEGMDFCYIPAGPFWLGSRDDDRLAENCEKPQGELDLAYPYWLGRYPVSNAQFGEFVAAGGYQEGAYWAEAIAAGFWTKGGFKGRWDNAPRSAPADYGTPFNLPNHPVMGLSWYEALAFGRWLSQQGQKAGWLPAGWQATLPSEAEWEKAARGGRQRPAAAIVRPIHSLSRDGQPAVSLVTNEEERRRYPWGPEPDPNRANYDETGIGATNVLGCFAAGHSLYGCEELSGNVWEWTRSQWQGYPYRPEDGREELAAGPDVGRVFRGGAFNSGEAWPRCSFRHWDGPHYFLWDRGFRVAVSPALHL